MYIQYIRLLFELSIYADIGISLVSSTKESSCKNIFNSFKKIYWLIMRYKREYWIKASIWIKIIIAMCIENVIDKKVMRRIGIRNIKLKNVMLKTNLGK